jgi:hypothetical protein
MRHQSVMTVSGNFRVFLRQRHDRFWESHDFPRQRHEDLLQSHDFSRQRHGGE